MPRGKQFSRSRNYQGKMSVFMQWKTSLGAGRLRQRRMPLSFVDSLGINWTRVSQFMPWEFNEHGKGWGCTFNMSRDLLEENLSNESLLHFPSSKTNPKSIWFCSQDMYTLWSIPSFLQQWDLVIYWHGIKFEGCLSYLHCFLSLYPSFQNTPASHTSLFSLVPTIALSRLCPPVL